MWSCSLASWPACGTALTHLKDRYTKQKKPLPLALNACILSEAFGFGTIKMSEMSDLDFNMLRSTREGLCSY